MFKYEANGTADKNKFHYSCSISHSQISPGLNLFKLRLSIVSLIKAVVLQMFVLAKSCMSCQKNATAKDSWNADGVTRTQIEPT